MKKINWFDANRSLSNEVVDFMRCFVWKADINAKFRKESDEIERSIENLDKLQGSILADKIPEMKQVWMARRDELDKQRQEQIEKEATYSLSEDDKKLKKALSDWGNGKSRVGGDVAICDWFKSHGLDVTDTAIVDEILSAAGEKMSVKTLVRSDGKIVTGFNSGNCFKMVFAKAYEHMVNAGTIKATQIPPVIAEKYAPKKKSNKKANKGE